MKKILVSGCSNCPYLTIWNDGEEKGIDSICSGSCSHPSFNRQLPDPRFTASVLLHYDPRNDQATDIKTTGMPVWCPLPAETQE